MGSGIAFLLHLLLVFAAIGHLLCVDSSVVDDLTKSTETSKGGGITASLIHRDQYFANDIVGLTHPEKMERDMRISKLRVQSLLSKRMLLAGTAASQNASPNPAPGSDDWQTPLSDAAAAEYLMNISLGTPARSFVAIADTGSDLTWLQCAPCTACVNGICGACKNDVFDTTKSSTYAALPCSSVPCRFLNESGSYCAVSGGGNVTGCEYGYAYGDGSQTIGYIAQETISLQTVTGVTQTVPNYWFGCSRNVASNSSLLDGTDGLVGLGRGNISFPTQLGAYFGKKFGYCLADRGRIKLGVRVKELQVVKLTNEGESDQRVGSPEHRNRSTSRKGVVSTPLFFGSDAVPVTSKNGLQLQYTPMITYSSTFYYVGCTGISLGGKVISTIPAGAFDIQHDGSGGIIFDSGTTYTSLSEQIFNPLVDAIKQQITTYVVDKPIFSGYSLCYLALWSHWIKDYGKGVPIVSFQFSNTSGFSLAVDNAWIKYDELRVCLAISNSSSNTNIFGNYQQVNYHVLYDLENKQIGFVQANCTVIKSNSHRPVASVGTSLVTGLLSLLLLLVLAQ